MVITGPGTQLHPNKGGNGGVIDCPLGLRPACNPRELLEPGINPSRPWWGGKGMRAGSEVIGWQTKMNH